jgi:hypothetical protein
MFAWNRLLLLAASLLLAGGALWALAFGESANGGASTARPRVEITLVKVTPAKR